MVQDAVAGEFESSAREIQSKAATRVQDRIPGEFDHMSEARRKRAENDLVLIKSGITFKAVSALQYEVASAFELSAYYEFGTGKYVFNGETWVDADLREYARNFYVNGKGITKPHPFLFNSFYEERVELIKRLKQKLNAQ